MEIFYRLILLLKLINQIWYCRHPLSVLLLPFSYTYQFVCWARRKLYCFGLLSVNRLKVPVIVVGNLTVGGAGKTPLVIWLANYLRAEGYRPGVVSRGYRGHANKALQKVNVYSNPEQVGDEPVLIARRSSCPVAISPKRWLAANKLIHECKCDVIISDDGLQHLGLHSDIKLCVIDGFRRFGNERCLPAGPLREPLKYLASMDMIASKGRADDGEYLMEYEARVLINLADANQVMELSSLKGRQAHALAGIATPDNFFSFLARQGIMITSHAFSDHYNYREHDIYFDDDLPVIMTEKDAVKCERFCVQNTWQNHWYVPIEAKLSAEFSNDFNSLLERRLNG